MNKLSKEERNVVYLFMLSEYEDLNRIYRNARSIYQITLCDVFYNIYNIYPFIYPGEGFDNHWFNLYLPELFDKIPCSIKSRYDSWFPMTKKGYKRRISLLNQCIKETL